MSALVVFVVVVGLPWVVLIASFKLVDRLQRRRDDLIARQIAVTDAIHREFGAVVAPTLRRARGGWRVTLPMDPRHPDTARIMEVAASTLGSTVNAEVAVVAPWRSAPRRIVPQNKERIASAMSA